MNKPRCKTRRRLNSISLAKMIVAMMSDASSVHELAEITGLDAQTVRHYVLTLHREGGCFIEHWIADSLGRHQTPSYYLGHGKDAKKPVLPRTEQKRRSYEKRKQREAMFALAGVPLRMAA
jgi:hypothetical protein